MKNKSKFIDFDVRLHEFAIIFDKEIPRVLGMSADSIRNYLLNERTPGALPLEDYNGTFCKSFQYTFDSHESSFKWAEDILDHKRVTAIDGSQIYPMKEVGIQISVIQVAYFSNPHTTVKINPRDAEVRIITPEDFKQSSSDIQLSRNYVDAQRFRFECNMVSQLMDKYPGTVFFFDGTLIPTFARVHGATLYNAQVSALNKLISKSEETHSPLVGYIDNSYAHDLFRMFSLLMSGIDKDFRYSDASLIVSYLKNFGDYTPIHICRREGTQDSNSICFTYMKTDQMRPSRLEFPKWMIEERVLNEVMDIIRAETIIGNGYPYSLDSAHDEAILKMRDKDVLISLLQKFAKDHNLKFHFSIKALKKRKRR